MIYNIMNKHGDNVKTERNLRIVHRSAMNLHLRCYIVCAASDYLKFRTQIFVY